MTQDFMETENFCRIFDKFFDLFNTRSVTEGQRKIKPNLNPYYDKEDPRLDVSILYKLSYICVY